MNWISVRQGGYLVGYAHAECVESWNSTMQCGLGHPDCGDRACYCSSTCVASEMFAEHDARVRAREGAS